MGRYPSRAKRCATVCQSLTEVANNLRELVNDGADIPADAYEQEQVGKAEALLADLDYSDLESLKDELESWKDNLPENLQNSNKASMLEDAVSGLESAIDALGSVNQNPSFDEIEDVAQSIEDAVSEAEGVEFPGMFS